MRACSVRRATRVARGLVRDLAGTLVAAQSLVRGGFRKQRNSADTGDDLLDQRSDVVGRQRVGCHEISLKAQRHGR